MGNESLSGPSEGAAAGPTGSESSRTVVCLAGSQTLAVVDQVAAALGLRVLRAATTRAALEAVAGSPAALVAALGVHPGVDTLFDGLNRSSLLDLAGARGVRCCVYSHTACREPQLAAICRAAGARAVVASPEGLSQFLTASQQPEPRATPGPSRERRYSLNHTSGPPPAGPGLARVVSREQPVCSEAGGWPHYATYDEYPPCRRWREHVAAGAGGSQGYQPRGALTGPEGWARILPPMLQAAAPDGLTVPGHAKVRFVVVSDTHSHHELLHLPDGDILLHCGDVVANYGDHCDLQQGLRDFCGWMAQMAQRYRYVVFIGGNHDTVLDWEMYPEHQAPAERALSTLPRNVVYLKESGVNLLGVKLWGAPYVTSRLEKLNQRFYSDGFERPDAWRKERWEKIPEGLDVLMTHGPPLGQRTKVSVSDPLLAERISRMREPPSKHVFGHEHDFPGVSSDGRTIYINAAQEGLLRMDPSGQGCAFLFDVETG